MDSASHSHTFRPRSAASKALTTATTPNTPIRTERRSSLSDNHPSGHCMIVPPAITRLMNRVVVARS